MTLTGCIKDAKLKGYINFDTVFVEKDPETERQKLYNWMLAQGYSVTATMTLKQLINILCGDINVKYYILNEILYILDSAAKVQNDILYISHGAEIVSEILKVKDVV